MGASIKESKLVLFLSLEECDELIDLLKEYKVVFAWSYKDLLEIDTEIVPYHSNQLNN